MMRYFFPIFLILLAFNQKGFTQSSLTLYAPAVVDKETLQDVSSLLSRSTGKTWQWTVEKRSIDGPGIFLTLANDPDFAAKEAYRLQSNGKDRMVISSSSAEGLVFGLYKHLRQLGYRFYLPDELYTLVPKLTHPFGSSKQVLDRPFLQVRDFFGTGGFGSGNTDPEQKVQKAWRLWKLRNGFGSAYHLAGHRGENFILENKELLRRNSNWLVSPLTGNDQTDQTIKLNYANTSALRYFADWTIKAFTQPNFTPPHRSHSLFESIEPSDGGGFANELSGAPAGLPSISDQVFGAANLAAQRLDALFPKHPNIGVNLYAYSSHAAPPSFKLHPRVFVQLVPYQFQNIAYGPSFIKLWAGKAKRFGMYDYFRYPDAQYDVPGGLTIDETMKRLQHSVRAGSEGVTYESSYSKFASGIPLWLLGRYMVDGDTAWHQSLTLLCRDLYGNSAPLVQQVFSLFYSLPDFGPQHMGNVRQLVQQAEKLSTSTDVQNRLKELKNYLYFVHLVYRSRDTRNGNLAQRTLPVAKAAWRYYQSGIVHSYRIMQLVSYGFLNADKNDKDYALYQQLHIDWFPETPRSKAAWNREENVAANRNRTDQDFEETSKAYPAPAAIYNYRFSDLTNLITAQGLTPQRTLVIGGSASVRGYFGVQTSQPTVLTLKYRRRDSEAPLVISTIDRNYSSDTIITAKENEGSLRINIPAGETTVFISISSGSYRLQADLPSGFYFFEGSPRGLMAFYKQFNDPFEKYTYELSFYPSYVFMPKGLNSLTYRVQLDQLKLIPPSGRVFSSTITQTEHGGFEIRSGAIRPEESGRFWKAIISGNYNYGMLNIPDRYLLLKEK